MAEHDIQSSIVEYLQMTGKFVFETDVMSGLQYFDHKDYRRYAFIKHHKKIGYVKGQADLVLVLQNRTVFLETKSPTGRQSPEQKEFERNVKELGHDYYVVRSIEEVQAIL